PYSEGCSRDEGSTPFTGRGHFCWLPAFGRDRYSFVIGVRNFQRDAFKQRELEHYALQLCALCHAVIADPRCQNPDHDTSGKAAGIRSIPADAHVPRRARARTDGGPSRFTG
ncbi:MAG: hypothetical protein ACRDVP_08575, partial [Acidimicrobiales bacterium]